MDGFGDRVNYVSRGDEILADQHNAMIDLLRRGSLIPGMYADANGVFQRRVPQPTAQKQVLFQLASSLNVGETAIAYEVTYSDGTRTVDDSTAYTLTDSACQYWGLSGERIWAVRMPDNKWEVRSNGEEERWVSLLEDLDSDDGAEGFTLVRGIPVIITVYRKGTFTYLYEDIVTVHYNAEDATWYVDPKIADHQRFMCQLKTALNPIGNATAYLMERNSSGMWTLTTDELTVTETAGQHWGLPGERIWCAYYVNQDSGMSIVEVQSSGAPRHRATLDGTLSQGAYAQAHLTINDTSVNVAVYDDYLKDGATLPNGSRVGISYDVETRAWYATNAKCS